MSLLFGPSKCRLHVHYTIKKIACLSFPTECTFHPTNCIWGAINQKRASLRDMIKKAEASIKMIDKHD